MYSETESRKSLFQISTILETLCTQPNLPDDLSVHDSGIAETSPTCNMRYPYGTVYSPTKSHFTTDIPPCAMRSTSYDIASPVLLHQSLPLVTTHLAIFKLMIPTSISSTDNSCFEFSSFVRQPPSNSYNIHTYTFAAVATQLSCNLYLKLLLHRAVHNALNKSSSSLLCSYNVVATFLFAFHPRYLQYLQYLYATCRPASQLC